MNILKTILLASLALFCTAGSNAKGIPLSGMPSELDGSAITAFQRDQQGYLWVGSEAGLTRYDGYEFKRYLHDAKRKTSISEDSVLQILEDSSGRIWISTPSGLDAYIRARDSFTQYRSSRSDPRSLDSNRIRQLFETANGEIWVLTPSGLNIYDRENDRFDRYATAENDAGRLNFSAVVQDAQGEAWIFESRQGFWKFDPKTKNFTLAGKLPEKTLSPKITYKDSANRIWVGSQANGLYQFFPDNLELIHYETQSGENGANGHAVRSIIEYPSGQLLVGMEDGGISALDIDTRKFSRQAIETSLDANPKADGASSFHKDSEGILWVGTARSGIFYHNPKLRRFTNFQHDPETPDTSLANDVVTSAFIDNKGRLMIGTDGGGFSILDPTTNTFQNFSSKSHPPIELQSDFIRKIDQDSQGGYWIAGWDRSIQRFTETEDRRFILDKQSTDKIAARKISAIWDLAVDKQDRLWITDTGSRAYLFDSQLNFVSDFLLSPGTRTVSDPLISETESGEVLISGSDGIYRFDESTQTLNYFLDSRLGTVVQQNPRTGLYYVGTTVFGLKIYDRGGKHIETLNEKSGLPGDNIRALQITENNDLWIATKRGICRWIASEDKIIVYSKSDGVKGLIYMSGATSRAKDGRLYFGSTDGLVSFLPDEMIRNSHTPLVTVDTILVSGSPFSSNPEAHASMNLNWKQNDLTFEFTGVSMTNPHQNIYAYKLDGFQDDWVQVNSDNRKASFLKLPTGDYTFRVKAANNDEIWSEEETTIAISIVPPFWRQTWFYALEALLFLTFIYSIVLYREQYFRKQRLKLDQLIQEKTQELQEHKGNLEVMVEKRAKQLVTAKDKAEESDRLKSQFLANFSHEIRTPLNAVMGFTSIIQETNPDEKSRDRFMSQIENNSQDLLSLIEDILDFSIIASNQLKIAPAPFSLNEFIENLESTHTIKFASKPIALRVYNELQQFDLRLLADRGRIKQILDNLLGNALKFTEKGFVELSVRKRMDSIIFEVTDSGHGVPDDQIDIIFDKFVKLHEDDIAARRGVGLGLAISKQLAELMEGDLSVKSKYGIGSRFSLEIPLKTAELPDADITDLAAALPHSNSLENKKVLVIEDEPASYLYLEAALNRIGLDTTWAANGFEGIGALKEFSAYDLIFLDIKMPGMDGYETLKSIREIAPNIHVIAQTAYARSEDEQRAKKAGFDDYITKPIERSTLVEVTHKHLGS